MNKQEKFQEGSYPPGSYNAVLQTFLKKRKGKISENTIARLFYNLQPIGEEIKGNLSNITREWLKEYVDELWLHYAPETIRTIVGDIRQFFKWCKKKGHTKNNLAKHIKPLRRRRRRNVKAAPEPDIKELMEYLAEQLKASGLVYRSLFPMPQAAEKGWSPQKVQALRDLFILAFLYETGARAGELSKLGAKSMNTVTRRPSPAYAITVTGKTNDRDYLFTERTAELWRMWFQKRPSASKKYAVVGWRKGRSPNRIKTNGISQMLVRRCGEVGVRPFRAQSLRHAKVKRSRKAVGIEMASILVDHSDIKTTWQYANIDDDELTEAAIKTGLQHNLWQ